MLAGSGSNRWYKRPWKRARIVRRTEELSEAEIAAIGRAEVPPGHEHLDEELI